jgi:hypothetical protein
MSITKEEIKTLADELGITITAVLAAQRKIEYFSDGELFHHSKAGWWYRLGVKWYGSHEEESEALGCYLRDLFAIHFNLKKENQ